MFEIMRIINALNGALSDTYIRQITIQEKLERLTTDIETDFKDINIPVKVRDIHKIERKNFIGISVFHYKDKEKYPVIASKKCCEDKHSDLLLTAEAEINHFNTSKYNQTINLGRNHFCCYCLQTEL